MVNEFLWLISHACVLSDSTKMVRTVHTGLQHRQWLKPVQTSKARSDTFMVVPRHANFRCNERAERLAWLAIISKGQPRDHANMCKGKSSGSDDIPASRLNPGWKIR